MITILSSELKKTRNLFQVPSRRFDSTVLNKLGENVDPVPFNLSGECEKGGLYFTTPDHIFKFMESDWMS
jgi:hypothetical protein